MLSEPKRAGQQAADAVKVQVGLCKGVLRGGLALELLELRLGVKEVDVAWSALHDQVNHRLRPGLKMRGPRLEIEGGLSRVGGSGGKVLAEQVGQGGSVGAGADAVEKAAPTQRGAAAPGLLMRFR